MTQVAIVGAGVAGLACATFLDEASRAGGRPLSITVLESAPVAGGHARSHVASGFTMEMGPNAFFPRDESTRRLLSLLSLEHRLVPANAAARRRYVLHGGRLHVVPDSPVRLLCSSLLSVSAKFRLLAEPWARRAPGAEESVHQFATRRFGPEIAERLVDPAVAGITAGDSRRVSASAQFPRLTEMERIHGSVFRAMLARRGTATPRVQLQSFDRGMGTMAEAAVARLGERVRTRTTVLAVTRARDCWRLETEAGPLAADQVVLAAPAHVTARLIASLEPEASRLLASIPFARVAVAALGYPRIAVPRPLDGYGYLVAREEQRPALGVLWESSIFERRAPAEHVLLRVFLGGSRQPALAGAAPDHLGALAREEVARTLGITAAPIHTSIHQWPDAIAQYLPGHVARREAVREALRRWSGLYVCGSSYDGVAFGDAIASGDAAASAVLASLAGSPSEQQRLSAEPRGVGAR